MKLPSLFNRPGCALVLSALAGLAAKAAVMSPRNLLVLPESETDTSIVLLWDKPVEHGNVAGYEIYQNGMAVATTPPGRTFHQATGLKPDTAYSFYVVAVDGGRDRSKPSPAARSATRPKGVVLDVATAPYLAKGDGVTKNTAAIQRAIDECPAGGIVRIPAGTFLTGPLVLKSDMSMHVSAGAILQGSTDPKDYLPMIWTRYMGIECECYQPLIRIGTMDHNAGPTTSNVTLFGEGEIRGGGETLGLQQPYDNRSQLVLIQNSRNVAIMGLHLTYPGGWTVHPLYSDNITAWDIKIESWDAPKGHSGDGFDPDSSTNCYLVNSVLHTWDNSFAPKSGRGLQGFEIGRPARHIRVVGCTLKRGAPCVGSEVSGGIEDVVVRDSTIEGTYFYFKTNDGRGAFVRNIVLEDVAFKGGGSRSIFVNTDTNMRNRAPKAPPYTTCNDYVFRNLTGCGDIILDGSFGLTYGPARQYYVHNVHFSNVEMQNGRSISLQFCDGVQFENVRCADGSRPVYTLSGSNFDISRDGQPLSP